MRFKYISILIVFLFFVLVCNTIIQTTPVWHESSQLPAGFVSKIYQLLLLQIC
jgi:hypothetical protein